MKHVRGIISVLTVIVTLFADVVPAAAQEASPAAADLGPATVPPGEPAFGWGQGQWGAGWIRWYLDHPSATEECAAGQEGPVWFLPAIAIAAGTTTFHCAVPTDRAILIPVVVAGNPSIDGCEATVDGPIEMAGGVTSRGGIEGFTVTVDGQIVPGLDRYRIRPTRVPPGASAADDEGATPAADASGAGLFACGYFVLLHPLPPGEHTIRLMLEAEDRLVQDQIYALAVVAPGQS